MEKIGFFGGGMPFYNRDLEKYIDNIDEYLLIFFKKVGGDFIISGANKIGNTITEGWAFINNEIVYIPEHQITETHFQVIDEVIKEEQFYDLTIKPYRLRKIAKCEFSSGLALNQPKFNQKANFTQLEWYNQPIIFKKTVNDIDENNPTEIDEGDKLTQFRRYTIGSWTVPSIVSGNYLIEIGMNVFHSIIGGVGAPYTQQVGFDDRGISFEIYFNGDRVFNCDATDVPLLSRGPFKAFGSNNELKIANILTEKDIFGLDRVPLEEGDEFVFKVSTYLSTKPTHTFRRTPENSIGTMDYIILQS